MDAERGAGGGVGDAAEAWRGQTEDVGGEGGAGRKGAGVCVGCGWVAGGGVAVGARVSEAEDLERFD